VNGNHEEAARYLRDGTPFNAAVYAGSSRNKFFPQPVPDGFYSGDTEKIDFIVLPADYYSWRWGDALFVVIDPYWHSEVAVDNIVGKNGGKKEIFGMLPLATLNINGSEKRSVRAMPGTNSSSLTTS
jgi:hypothetical protein